MNESGYTPKNLKFGEEGRTKLINGIRTISAAVKSTLGPSGQTVLIESPHHTHGITVTKDGVTVAKAVDLIDPIENLAVRMMKEAADRTATSAGDGPQPIYSNVLTPDGWKSMSGLSIGDVICGTHYSHQNVLGVFPKGKLEIYEVVFGDGRVVECSSNHLWTVTTNYGIEKTLTTDSMLRDFVKAQSDGSNSYKYFVRNHTVEFNNSGNFPIDPYTLGLLLGDGSLSGTGSIELSLGAKKGWDVINSIIPPKGIKISVQWNEDKNYFRAKFNGKTEDGLSMFDLIKSVGLLGTKSDTKFIPESYLYSSVENRIKLLDGLLTTDGYINSRGLFEFSTVSDKLADDFQELILSLGYSFNRRLHNRDNDINSYSDKSIHRIQQLKGYKYGSKIVDIRPTGITTEMMCIKVSNEDHLYITDGYIPTHNTTTSIILAEAFVIAGTENIDDHNKTEVLRDLVKETEKVVVSLKAKSRKVSKNNLRDVATISANNDKELGKVISDVYKAVGSTGIVTVDKSQTSETYYETTMGLKVDRGYTSPLFINDQKKDECILEDVHILVSDAEITNILNIEAILKPVIQDSKRLLIIAPCSSNVINTLAANVMKGGLKICVIAPPSFGYRQHELMHDIAVSVGATYFSEKTGDDLSIITMDDLGHASKIIAAGDSTVIIKDEIAKNGEAIEERLTQLKDAYKNAVRKGDKEFVLSRIASLSGGVGVIYAGGKTDLEQKELYDRIDDAVCAVRSALEEGIVPGGGLALYEESLKYDRNSKSVADRIMYQALRAPIMQILENAGKKLEDVYNFTPEHYGHGYDVKNDIVGDMYQLGVIDPLKVTKNALQNAVSVAVTILSTNAIITMARTYENE